MSQYQYFTVDVFTSEQFKGNPLAVFPDARGIPETRLQEIAKEFNYSEITFVYPPSDPNNTARVRIFTPTNEIPFAGHPNIGTAFILAQQEKIFDMPVPEKLVFEEQAGLVNIEIIKEDGVVSGAKFSIENKLIVSSTLDLNDVANCANIHKENIVTVNHQPVIASVGLPFAFVEVDTIETLNRAFADLSACLSAEDKYKCLEDHFALFLYTKIKTENGSLTISSRMFAPINNIIEDPATGSASAALTSYLLQQVYPDLNQLNIHFTQGKYMGRESHIHTTAIQNTKYGCGRITVSGNCVAVMQGKISVLL